MRALIMTFAVIGLLAAGGCSLPELAPETASPPAPSGGALPPPESAPEAAAETTSEPGGEVAPDSIGESGTVVESITGEPALAGGAAITLPERSGWTHPEVPLTKQQEDIETCFRFASAQINRESRIDQDRYEGDTDRDFVNLYGETTLTQRVDYYSERRRRGGLFDACMQSKGYIKD